MATTQAADVSYISKVIYKDGIQQKQIVRDKPLLLSTKHNTKFTSAEGIKVPILYGTGQGASATVANAATNASPDAGAAFTVTQATYYTNFDIHGKVVRNALKGNDDSFFLQQLKLAMDNAQETMGSELNRQASGTSAGVYVPLISRSASVANRPLRSFGAFFSDFPDGGSDTTAAGYRAAAPSGSPYVSYRRRRAVWMNRVTTIDRSGRSR